MEKKLNAFQSDLKSTDDKVQKILDLVQSRKGCVDDCCIDNIVVKLTSLEEMISTIKDELDTRKVVNSNLTKPVEKPTRSAESSPGKTNYLEINIQRARNNGRFHVNTAYLDPNYEPQCCDHPHVPGRGGHNVPVDGLQCCFHHCRNNPHYRREKPR